MKLSFDYEAGKLDKMTLSYSSIFQALIVWTIYVCIWKQSKFNLMSPPSPSEQILVCEVRVKIQKSCV